MHLANIFDIYWSKKKSIILGFFVVCHIFHLVVITLPISTIQRFAILLLIIVMREKKQSSKIDPCLSIVSRGRSCKCREHHIYNNSPNINGHCTNKRINKTGIFLFDNTRTRLYKNAFYIKLLNLVFLLLWLFSNFDLSVTAMTLLNETRV